MFRFIRPPLAVVGNKTVAEDTLANGEKKAVAVAEVELADVEGAPAEDELELDAAFVLDHWFSCSFSFFNLLAHPCSDIITGCSTLCDQQLLVKCSCCCPVPIKQHCHSCLPSGRCFNAWNRHVKPFLCTNKYSSCSLKIEVQKLAILKNPCV